MIKLKDSFMEFMSLRKEHFKGLMNKTDLTYLELELLQFLATNPERNTLTDILDSNNYTKSHASTAINNLAKNGYISKTPSPDNKKVLRLNLLPKSASVIDEAQVCISNFRKVAFKGISDEELGMAINIVKKAVENLKADQNK